MNESESRWAPDGEEARALRRRAESMWNRDYFEGVVVPLLDVRPNGNVLDVGTGLGSLAFLLCSVRPDLSLTGVDSEVGLVEEANAAAQGLGLDRVRFEVTDAASLPYEDDLFDLVMCQTLLGHVPDPTTVVEEMARIVKPGGAFFAAEWTDRALSAIPVDNVLTPTVGRAAETYRLTKTHSEGRRILAGVTTKPDFAHRSTHEMQDSKSSTCDTAIGFGMPFPRMRSRQSKTGSKAHGVGPPTPSMPTSPLGLPRTSTPPAAPGTTLIATSS